MNLRVDPRSLDHRDGQSSAAMRALKRAQSLQWGQGVGTRKASVDAGRHRGKAFAPLPGQAPVALVDHREGMCRWPVGEPAIEYCGATVHAAGANYCTHHETLSRPREGSPATVTALDLRQLERMAR